MNIKKLSIKYNLNKIKEELNLFNYTDNQISLQYHKDCEGLGSVKYIKYNEKEYTTSKIPENSEIQKFIKDNFLYRTRVMKILPKTCYSFHSDYSKRIHLAVQTDERCKIAFEDECIHVPADGYGYLIDTTKKHTAFNGTFNCERIHIVGCI